jgi:glycosyltransferase involved in cell wall biosynthesis
MSSPVDIFFACYYSLACNSGAQIFSLANHLAARGHAVTVFVPFDPEATATLGEAQFRTRPFTELPAAAAESAANGRPAIAHIWTPRENVRQVTTELVRLRGLRYVVHLEDNEPLITSTNTGIPFAELARRPADEVSRIVGERLTNPQHFQPFLAGAAGISGLIDRLMEFAPPGPRQLVFWPGFNEKLFHAQPRNDALRRQHGIDDKEVCLAYAGNVASVNRDEVRSLYLSVAVLGRMGIPARLVRAGEDYVPLFPERLDEVASRIINLGKLPHRDVPPVYAMADFLVQPGRPDPFNEFRFPSKLPEFFAMGRPVLLPATNLGRFVRDGTDAVVLHQGHGMEIAEKIAALAGNTTQRRDLGERAAAFAHNHFRWADIAARVEAFYRDILATPG